MATKKTPAPTFSVGSSYGSPGKLVAPRISATLPKEEAGWLSVLSTSPPVAMKIALGPAPASVSGGVGGWQSADRPRRRAATEWQSSPIEVLEVQVVFDGLSTGFAIDGDIARLKSLGVPGGVTFGALPIDVEPPVLRLGGNVPHGGKKWVLNDIAWDSEDVVWIGLQRFRQFANLTFMEYRPATPVKTKRAASTKAPAGKTRTVKAKKDDTLAKIAKREMKPKTGAALKKALVAMKKLNGIRSSKTVLKTGRAVKLPRSG